MGRRAKITPEEAYDRRKERVFLNREDALVWARAYLKRMKRVMACAIDVRVTGSIPLESACAQTAYAGKVFAVRVAPGMTPIEIEDIVIHEYAHARAWAAVQAKSTPHDSHWGIEYSSCYRAFHQAE